jgi:LEA14-like dessication related protein
MTFPVRPSLQLLAAATVLLASACQRPDPPILTPRSAKITAITPQGVDVLADLDVENPNGFALSARSVSAKVKLDGKYDVGSVKVASPLSIPAHKTAHLSVPLSFHWTTIAALGALAAAPQSVPYDVDGTVEIGGESLSVDLPFHVSGTLTHEQLVQAAVGSLPKIPGLNIH